MLSLNLMWILFIKSSYSDNPGGRICCRY